MDEADGVADAICNECSKTFSACTLCGSRSPEAGLTPEERCPAPYRGSRRPPVDGAQRHRQP